MAYMMPDAYEKGTEAIVIKASEFGFYKGEVVFYVDSIRRSNGEIWHKFKNAEGEQCYLVDGDFEINDSNLDIGWSDVLRSDLKYHGHIGEFFQKVVRPSGYPYFLWNDVIYKVVGRRNKEDYVQTKMMRNDL